MNGVTAMKKNLWDKEWKDLTRKEEKYRYKHFGAHESVLSKLQKIVPKGMQDKLDTAFVKAFQLDRKSTRLNSSHTS